MSDEIKDTSLDLGLKNADQIAKIQAGLGELSRKVSSLGTAIDGVQGTLAGQAEVLHTVDAISDTVDDLVVRFNSLFPAPIKDGDMFYTPHPTPRFWKLTGRERDQAITRIRTWVVNVYIPTFGHISGALPPCWEQHDLCLTSLDVLMELHGVHFLQPVRNQGLLTGQAELLSRMMPALADLMRAEQRLNCSHSPEAMLLNGRTA